jgi:SAM-dependent methyltransferase
METIDYFHSYEDRYRRLREQGVDDWIYRPEELTETFAAVDEFLALAKAEPQKTSIIEFGCGQGHLAEHLIDKGFKYLGIDISVLAITHARRKLRAKGHNSFKLGNVTSLKHVPDNSYDIAIDNQCFHMLVTDVHRWKYLGEIKRILTKNGKVFFRENYQPDEFKESITSIQQFDKLFNDDQKTPHKYTAFVNGEERKVELPRLPARGNNEEGYKNELAAAGFNMEYFKKSQGLCIMYASVSSRI